MSVKARKHRKASETASRSILVIGLGRFGLACGSSLEQLGREVLGIDSDPNLVQRASDQMPHVVEADATDVEALRQLGCEDFDTAIIGIGSDMESSLLCALALMELKIGSIWAKAINDAHGRILKRIGVHHIVYPELRTGQHVAHIITDKAIDSMNFENDFVLMKTRPPKALVGRCLNETKDDKVKVLGLFPPGGPFIMGDRSDHTIADEDVMVIGGLQPDCEAFIGMATPG